VAGNPTQFVMYRAARAAGVDWRFFTSQVAIDQFETAFRGVQALGLDGVALMEPFQSRAIPLMDSVTESALALGKVNVARSDASSWLGDNTLGAALSRCIETRSSRVESVETNLPLPADEESLGAIVVLDAPELAKVIGLASPSLRHRIIQAGETPEHKELRQDTVEDIRPQAWSDGPTKSVDELARQKSPVDFLILKKIPSSAELRLLASLRWGERAGCLLMESQSEKHLRPLRESLISSNVEWIDAAELMANQAAADFHFWTGVVPSVELIRESLEEYLQW
jgi:hypothetical protein